MRLVLKRKWVTDLKTYYIGTIVEVFDGKAKELIQDGIAEKYTGEYPPKGKRKTEFFKQKSVKKNGKD